ncbi:MAG: [LysW]-lysine hydrolase [Planctomycetes bacterium]|nr:[LysW]-lysine hydrolase [Planctomycetota bacterium]
MRVLHDLVATPSVSGSEAAAVRVFVRHAAAMGFETEIDAAGNGLAHRGASAAGAAVHIVLLGHIDTVPGHIPVRIEDGVLHGRGSVDAKGPLAAMLVGAANAELPAGVRVTVAGAVGEETADSPGARHLAGQFRPDACIIGEPSGWDGVTLGYKGRLIGRLVCERSCAHTAGPGLSAADEVLAWWWRILADVESFNGDRARVFERIQASVRGLSGGSDGLTEAAVLEAGFRLPPGVDPHELAQRLEALAGDGCGVTWRGHEVAHATDRNDPVVRALSGAIRSLGATPRPKLKTGTADLNVVGPVWGCPIAAYGPGDSSLDHTPEERLDIAEFARSVGVLQRGMELLAAELGGA